jgi:hypothetical protein
MARGRSCTENDELATNLEITHEETKLQDEAVEEKMH